MHQAQVAVGALRVVLLHAEEGEAREHAQERSERTQHPAPEARHDAVHEQERDQREDDEPGLVEVDLVRGPDGLGEEVLGRVAGRLHGAQVAVGGDGGAADAQVLQRGHDSQADGTDRDADGIEQPTDGAARRRRAEEAPTSCRTCRAASPCVLLESTRLLPLTIATREDPAEEVMQGAEGADPTAEHATEDAASARQSPATTPGRGRRSGWTGASWRRRRDPPSGRLRPGAASGSLCPRRRRSCRGRPSRTGTRRRRRGRRSARRPAPWRGIESRRGRVCPSPAACAGRSGASSSAGSATGAGASSERAGSRRSSPRPSRCLRSWRASSSPSPRWRSPRTSSHRPGNRNHTASVPPARAPHRAALPSQEPPATGSGGADRAFRSGWVGALRPPREGPSPSSQCRVLAPPPARGTSRSTASRQSAWRRRRPPRPDRGWR